MHAAVVKVEVKQGLHKTQFHSFITTNSDSCEHKPVETTL